MFAYWDENGVILTNECISMKFYTNVHGLRRMNLSYFYDPLTFHEVTIFSDKMFL